jgi:serine/threonine protein kinase
MKQIGKKKLHERRVINNLVLEKKVLAEIKSDFIIELSFAFQDKTNCYFVMEYAVGGDTYSFLNNPKQHEKVLMYKQCGEAAPRFIIACVILGLECLHRQNIMYRDLKPENVLVFANGYPKLTDFGLAKKNAGDEISRTMAGTKIYFCPEIVEKKGN